MPWVGDWDLGSEDPPSHRKQEDKELSSIHPLHPTPSPLHLLESIQEARILLKRGENHGEKEVEWGRGLWREDMRSKTREIRRKRKPLLLPQIDSPQCLPPCLCSKLQSRMLPL
jgi:hypothetical protein